MVEPGQSFTIDSVEHAGALARAIVDTIREPLLVLDLDQRVVAASRSFYELSRSSRGTRRVDLLRSLG